jgi:ubiquinone/menaquinone biosynthesis C-methylase UbiE
MSSDLNDMHTYVPDRVARDEMNWDAYAEHYDEMCRFNPAYQENIDIFAKYLMTWGLPEEANVCDLGAGTGNYILKAAEYLPNASYLHVDFDTKMNELAQRKYAQAKIDTVDVVTEYAQHCDFPASSFDLVICVNALYAISPQEDVLRSIHSWLKPSARLFIIDFGRKQRTLEWTLYMFRESLKRNRAGEYVKALLDSREVFKQNRKSTKGQESGRYWLHSTDAFRATLESCGYHVDEVYPCYRDYADLAVCRRIA